MISADDECLAPSVLCDVDLVDGQNCAMPEDLMRYDHLAQDALRGVVREALRRVEKSGLPGEHHFYIAFMTANPGCPDRRTPAPALSARNDHRAPAPILETCRARGSLSRSNCPSTTFPRNWWFPFGAVKGFLDPAVQFGLQFETVNEDEGAALQAENPQPAASAAPATRPKLEAVEPAATTEASAPAPKVVSLDAFRKK